MPFMLRKLRIREVSSVDKGASIGARVALWKARWFGKGWQGNIPDTVKFLVAEGRPQDQAVAMAEQYARAHGVTKEDTQKMAQRTLDQVLASLSEDDKTVVLNSLQQAAQKAGTPPPAPPVPPAAGPTPPKPPPPANPPNATPAPAPAMQHPTPPAPVPQHPVPPPAPKAQPNPIYPPVHKREDQQGENPMPETEIEKALPEEIRKQLAEIPALKADIAKLNDEKVEKLYVEKAQTLKAIPGCSTDELGKLLKSAAGLLPKEQFAVFEKILAATQAIVEKSAAFQQTGTGSAGEVGASGTADGKAAALEKLDAMAKALVEKSTVAGVTMPFVKAYTAVCDQNPKLFAQAVA